MSETLHLWLRAPYFYPTVTVAFQLVDADTGQLLRDCGSGVVPAVCVVPLSVRSRAIAVEVVVTAVSGTGPYTLTLVAQ